MKPIVIAVGGLLGLGLLLALSSENEAQASGPSWQNDDATFPEIAAIPTTWTLPGYTNSVKNLAGMNTYTYSGAPQWLRDLAVSQDKVWGQRRAPLMPQVQGKESTAYKELYRGPWVPVFLFENGRWQWTSRNRYGQHAPGTSTNLWGAALTAAGYVLPMVPGIGTAANAALQTAIAIGQGKSLDEAALAGVRGALPPWGQVAFDLGVGVALKGESLDQAAINAGLNQLEAKYPGAKKAYADGRDIAKGLGL